MMESPKQSAPLPPNELWDQLAVQQIGKALAPRGFKKIIGGKAEVANIQFLSKSTVHACQVMSANMIRLYRELFRESLTEYIKNIQSGIDQAEKAIKECRFWEYAEKRILKNSVLQLAASKATAEGFLATIDQIKPATPKNMPKQKKKTVIEKPAASKIVDINGHPISSN